MKHARLSATLGTAHVARARSVAVNRLFAVLTICAGLLTAVIAAVLLSVFAAP